MKTLSELKKGDVFFIHSIYAVKKQKHPCTFIEMENDDKYMKIRYKTNGITDYICIGKKFKDKPASISITVDDSKEAYMEMQNARKADFFCVRNKYLRKKYSCTHVNPLVVS